MNNELYYQCEDYFFRAISKKCLGLKDQVAVYLTGVEVDNLNLLILKKNLAKPHDTLAKYAGIFAENKLPWMIVIPENFFYPPLEESLKTLGFASSENSESGVAMFIDLNQLDKFQFRDNLLIKSVDSNLTDWMLPLIEAFESTHEITSQYKQTHERALANKARFQHFSLYVDNKPVSSLTISMNNNAARIDDVATLPSYQKKGYATHLIKYALAQARNSGAAFCFLEASDSGLSVYEKIGFNSLFKRKYIGKIAP